MEPVCTHLNTHLMPFSPVFLNFKISFGRLSFQHMPIRVDKIVCFQTINCMYSIRMCHLVFELYHDQPILTSDFFCYHSSHTLDSIVALQRQNSWIYQYQVLMSLPLPFIGDMMIMEMSHCSPLLSIIKLFTVITLFGSTHICDWANENGPSGHIKFYHIFPIYFIITNCVPKPLK